jgi:hypothetical protein
MSSKIFFGAVVLVIFTSGCAVKQNPEAIGPYPSDYKEIIKSHVLKTYFDPYSIRSASISQPIQGHLFFEQGWIVCLEVNSKNRMGGYIGVQQTAYLLNRGSVIQSMMKASMCNSPKVSFSPWPELEQIK